MSLRDRLGKTGVSGQDKRQLMFGRLGVLRNPYPPAGEPTGHPHMETSAEEPIVRAIESFERDRVSQVFLIEGTQGVGKSNLLNYFQGELRDLYKDSAGYYIIRYYPDPESTFDGILRRIFQEFEQASLLTKLASHLSQLSNEEQERIIEIASGHEMKVILRVLLESAQDEDKLKEVTSAAYEWLTGLRILKKHRELLKISFRLDTVESKTQALRDIVFCCSDANLLNGVYLLLDELEKQDYSFSKTIVLRYLSAIRALIDALPKHLFLLVALTIEARRRYFAMLPAFAGRLQNIVTIDPIKTAEAAIQLNDFYLKQARDEATRELGKSTSTSEVISKEDVRQLFSDLLRRAAAEKAQEGVTHRDLLNALHLKAEATFAQL
jgi:hypothetical protein